MRRIWPAVMLGGWLLVGCSPRPASLAEVRQAVRDRFPEVRQISVAELAGWMDDTARPAPVLLDVRTEAEFAASHLRGAQRVEPGGPLPALDRDRPVVTYCTVGYRSSDYARRLTAAGWTDVRQLDGSLFEWFNRGYPVYRDGKPVAEVHPYSAAWGRYLAPPLQAPAASPRK